MKKLSLMLATLVLFVIAGCSGPVNVLRNVADASENLNRIGSNTGYSNSSSTSVYGGGSGDMHYIQSDDYFISENGFDSGWMRIDLAKMIQAPSSETKNEGKFMDVKDAREIWTSHYWKTRIAQPSDLKLGTVIVAFDYTDNDIYVRPENQELARTDNWFMAKITDTSTLYQNVVMVSGGYRVKTDNLRVIE